MQQTNRIWTKAKGRNIEIYFGLLRYNVKKRLKYLHYKITCTSQVYFLNANHKMNPNPESAEENTSLLSIKGLEFNHIPKSWRRFAQLIKIAARYNLSIRKLIYTITFYNC